MSELDRRDEFWRNWHMIERVAIELATIHGRQRWLVSLQKNGKSQVWEYRIEQQADAESKVRELINVLATPEMSGQ